MKKIVIMFMAAALFVASANAPENKCDKAGDKCAKADAKCCKGEKKCAKKTDANTGASTQNRK